METVVNFFRIRMIGPGHPPSSPDSPHPTCSKCGLTRLPRSHHCSTCKQCTLQMDHHCYLVGVCIGKHNFRYFLLWLIWVLIGGVAGGLLTIYPVWEAKGQVGFIRNCLCFTLSMCWALVVVVSLLLYSHYTNAMKGQTTIESIRKDHTYDLGPRKNWEAVFGRSRLWLFGVYTSPPELPI